jgi:hypothetical protein
LPTRVFYRTEKTPPPPPVHGLALWTMLLPRLEQVPILGSTVSERATARGLQCTVGHKLKAVIVATILNPFIVYLPYI